LGEDRFGTEQVGDRKGCREQGWELGGWGLGAIGCEIVGPDVTVTLGEVRSQPVVGPGVADGGDVGSDHEGVGEPDREREDRDGGQSPPEPANQGQARCRAGSTGASRPVPPLAETEAGVAFSSWYSASTFTLQMSWVAPRMFSTASIAVYME